MAGIWDLAPATAPADNPKSVWELAPAFGATPATPRQANGISQAVISGLQSSATGLALRGKLPDQELSADAPWYVRAAAGAGGVAGDFLLSVAGGVAGMVAGSAVAPGAGTVVGGGAGAFAVPMALRDGLITAYNQNHAASWEGVWEIAKSAAVGGTKGAVIGGATMGAGRFVAGALPAATGAVARGTVAAGAELGTLTTTAAALEGRLPTAQEFVDNAVLLGGMKGAVAVAKGMRNVYAETGRTPAEQVMDAKANPTIKEALAKGEVPKDYEPLALEQRIQAAYNQDSRPADVLKSLNESPLGKTPVSTGAGAERKPLTDPVRIEYVTDEATHQGLIRLIADTYKSEIEAQRRGVITNEQTMAAAKDMLGAGKLLPREIGSADNNATLAARLIVLKSADADVIAQAEAYRSTPLADRTPAMDLKLYAAIERQAALQAEAQGALAEWGRAGQIVRQISRDPSMLDTGKDLLALVKRKGNFQDIADVIVSLKDPAQRAAFAREAVKATTTEKVIEAWKASILSGPLTHLANLMGNATKWAVDLPESILSASITAGRMAAKGDPLTMAQFKARAMSPLIGLQLGTKDALIVAGEVLRHDTKTLEKADIYRTAIEGKTGEVVRTPFRLLQAQDALFRIPAERAKTYELAVDRAVKDGLHPETVEGRQAIAGYMALPTLGLAAKDALKATEAIDQAGSEAVFAQRLGPRLKTAQRAMAGHWSQMIVPFVRTPANLVSWAIQHTPGLNLMSGRWRDAFAAGGEQRDKAVARVVIGTGLAMTAFSMAEDGTMTGGGMFDKEQGATKRAAGWQPYSVKIGDTYYSYQRMEPVAKVLGIAADLVEMMEATKDDEDKAKMASMLVMMFGNATISTTYLSGLANAVQSITDPVRYGDNFMEQYATSLVPKVVGQTVTLADPYKREVDGVMEAIQSQMPYFREKLMPKRDVWGQPSKNDRWFDVMPVATSEISKDKVKTEAVRLSLALNDAPKFVLERGPFKPGEKKIELTGEQRDIYRQVAGGNAMTILAPIVNSPDWDRIPDFAKAKIYQSVVKGARAQGEYAALPPDAASRDEMRRKLLNKIIEQTDAVR